MGNGIGFGTGDIDGAVLSAFMETSATHLGLGIDAGPGEERRRRPRAATGTGISVSRWNRGSHGGRGLAFPEIRGLDSARVGSLMGEIRALPAETRAELSDMLREMGGGHGMGRKGTAELILLLGREVTVHGGERAEKSLALLNRMMGGGVDREMLENFLMDEAVDAYLSDVGALH